MEIMDLSPFATTLNTASPLTPVTGFVVGLLTLPPREGVTVLAAMN